VRNVIMLLVAALLLALPHEANATLQCVAYAREVTGLNLKGDAWKWWEAAQGVYERGNTPKVDSVLVFKRQGKMSHGHVAVVRGTASSRVLLVDHANWAPSRTAGRGKVTTAVPVMDVSPKNDWSEVRVWYQPSREYGSKVYKTQGFVYRPGKSVVEASLRSETPVQTKVEALPAPVRSIEPEAKLPEATVIEAKVIEAKVIEAVAPAVVETRKEAPAAQPAPPAAITTVENGLGKFDVSAWAEQS
jgi:surface antigen